MARIYTDKEGNPVVVCNDYTHALRVAGAAEYLQDVEDYLVAGKTKQGKFKMLHNVREWRLKAFMERLMQAIDPTGD